MKGGSFLQDLKLDLDVFRNGLVRTSRFEIAMQYVCKDLVIQMSG
jgi:hypothetical protein